MSWIPTASQVRITAEILCGSNTFSRTTVRSSWRLLSTVNNLASLSGVIFVKTMKRKYKKLSSWTDIQFKIQKPMLKKTLKITGIILLVLILAAIAIPYFFKDKIVAFAKTEINKNVNARVDFTDVDISFFRRFPRVAVALENLQVIGLDEFSKDTLISSKNIDVAVNLMSIISGNNMKIYSITVNQPRIRALVTKDGKA